ncbi:DUF6415 family natural product biosynthesis protein [Streptomyces hygroscopicus]|uniref:DUF6415 family natural product biosynthesis protein n=1 Tax=Streptomyces sp. NPDC001508 TaxID=3154656 RepID=UPI00071F0FD2|nr:hypothetical protein SHL15_6262 [Streptomyces hygroscopicus subsp. limoneus]
MRRPMTSRRNARQRVASTRQDGTGAELGPQRDRAVAAAETVALVLAEESPLPESADDVEELARRLRGHISQLAVVAPSGACALRCAQQLASVGVPDGYMPSRVHLIRLAEATQALIAVVRAHGVVPAKPRKRRRWWNAQANVLRGAVFALALACLVVAASVPRT